VQRRWAPTASAKQKKWKLSEQGMVLMHFPLLKCETNADRMQTEECWNQADDLALQMARVFLLVKQFSYNNSVCDRTYCHCSLQH
jgi:hypothetical protein